MPKGRRGYYKQPDSIWREPWGNDLVASLVRLQAFLNERWARDGLTAEEAGRAVIPIQTFLAIVGRSRRQRGTEVATMWSQAVSITVHFGTRSVTVDWPKFAEYQYGRGLDRGHSARKSRGNSGEKRASASRNPHTSYDVRGKPPERWHRREEGEDDWHPPRRPAFQQIADLQKLEDCHRILHDLSEPTWVRKNALDDLFPARDRLSRDVASGVLPPDLLPRYRAINLCSCPDSCDLDVEIIRPALLNTTKEPEDEPDGSVGF
jgi:hypothetical protein